MTKPIQALVCICLSLTALVGVPASATEGTARNALSVPSPDDGTRAKALLDRAVAHYQAHRENAFAAFSRAGEFVDGDLYVYVIGDDGTMQASGGPSIILVGHDVNNLKDAEGKLFIKEMMDGAKIQGSGSVEYRWLNREHGKVERKVTQYRKVGDVIVAVGYYIPRAAPKEAKALLKRATEVMAQDATSAIIHFNDMNGGFIEDDLYVFVVGLKDKIMHAHGSMPRLIGRSADDLRDVNGKPIIRQMIAIAKAKGSGELQYRWENPVTHKKERKTTYLQRVNGYLVAVGHYER